MMGLFVMAAMMGFQSIPIGQAVSQELTQSFTDLSRSAETKSYGDLYFFNFVPTGAEHSINNMSHSLGKEGGNVTWNDGEFDPENEVSVDVRSKTDEIVNKMKRKSEEYFNDKYAGVSQAGGCSIPPINYTIDTFPETDDILLAVENNENKMPITVGSQVEIDYTGYGFYPDVEASPMEVECSYDEGDTKYIGDTQNSGSSGDSGGSGTGIGPGLGFGLFGDWSSLGYTTNLNVSANRYHILARETSEFYKRLNDQWTGVQEETGHSSWTCSLGHSEKVSAVSSAVSDVENSITNGKSSATSNLQPLPDGIEIKENSIDTYDSFLGGDVTTGKFKGSVSTTVQNGDCVCSCAGEDCCNDEQRYKATATPETTKHYLTLKDTKYKVITENGWKNLNFTVSPYNHDFQNDD